MLKKIIHYLITLVIAFVLVNDAYAGGGKRSGTAGAQELLLPVSARALALSGANVANIQGIDALYYNPAGLGASANSVDAMFSYMSYIADIGHSYAAVGVNFEGLGSIGFSVRSLDFGDIPVTTEENPYGTGATFSPTFVTLGFSYANSLTDRIRVGMTMNLVNESIMSTSATGFAFDAGVQYSNVAGIDGFMMGIVLKNLGPQMSYDGADLLRVASEDEDNAKRGDQFYKIDAASFELPSQLEIGVAYKRNFTNDFVGTISTSFQNNNFSPDEYRISGEFVYNRMLSLRGGYTYVSEAVDNEEQYLFGPTFGVGLDLGGQSLKVVVDYAYRWARYFDANHMVAVKLGF